MCSTSIAVFHCMFESVQLLVSILLLCLKASHTLSTVYVSPFNSLSIILYCFVPYHEKTHTATNQLVTMGRCQARRMACRYSFVSSCLILYSIQLWNADRHMTQSKNGSKGEGLRCLPWVASGWEPLGWYVIVYEIKENIASMVVA
jgi:hypothetical protein